MGRSPSFHLFFEREKRRLHCGLYGEAEGDMTQLLEATLSAWLEETGGVLILNIQALNTLDTDTLRLFDRLHALASEREARLIIVTRPLQDKLLRAVGLDRTLNLAPMEAQANCSSMEDPEDGIEPLTYASPDSVLLH